jgi:hypothetical protein
VSQGGTGAPLKWSAIPATEDHSTRKQGRDRLAISGQEQQVTEVFGAKLVDPAPDTGPGIQSQQHI